MAANMWTKHLDALVLQPLIKTLMSGVNNQLKSSVGNSVCATGME